MLSLTTIGLIAGSMTTASFVPQVMRVWRTRSTTDISLGMFLLMTGGVSLWLIYGLLIGDTALIAANGITLVLAASILIAKLRYG